MTSRFVTATKQQRKLRLALVGYEGTGKTYSALGIATAMARSRAKDEGGIALIDTENGSAAIYADKFAFDTLTLTTHSPEAYIEAIKDAIVAKYDVLIIDSLSHEWMGKDGALEQVDNIGAGDGGKFRAWGAVTPRHRAVFERISSAPLHVITTMRQKKAYVQETDERTKKTVVRHIGTEPVQREGSEFESDIIGVLDQDNTMRVTKSRIASLQGKTFHHPGKDFAELMLADLRAGKPEPEIPANLPTPQKAEVATPTLPLDASGPMTGETRESIEKARTQANAVGTTAAQIRLKNWGYKTWAAFLTDGTALQADEIIAVLGGEPVVA
jgi:hypothetical protein